MNAPTYLKPWLANWNLGLRIVIFLILFSGLIQFATFSLNQAYLLSFFGAQPEDITFSIQITYVGILSMLLIIFRFLRYFELKSFLITALLSAIMLCISSLFVTNIIQFFIIRFLQGVAVCSISGSMMLIIPMFVTNKEAKQPISSAVFYGTVLSSGVFIGLVTANVEVSTNINVIYVYLVLYLVFILILVILGFNNKSGIRPYPLYQIDWIGACFFTVSATAFAYTMIYGSKYYWFTDYRIKTSALIAVSGALLFVYRELTVKRPAIDLSVFKYPKFWAGMLLLALYYGMKESINLIFAYTANVVQWSPTQITLLGLANVTGLVTFMIITAELLAYHKGTIFRFFTVGFSMMLLYHLWMYFIFTPDLSFEDLMFPLFFQGAASGILFVPIMVFMTTSVPQTTGLSGLVIAADVRFTALVNASAGFYNLQLYYNQLYKEGFLRHLTNTDEQTTEQIENFKQLYLTKGYSSDQASALANSSIAKATGIQSQLLTDRAVFLFISIIIVVILAIILIIHCGEVYVKLKEKDPVISVT